MRSARGAGEGALPAKTASLGQWSGTSARHVHSFRATSGPVIRLRSGNVEAMIASEAASPPTTVAQYRDSRDRGTRCRPGSGDRGRADTRPTTIDTAATRRSGSALSSATTRCRSAVGTPVSLSKLNGRFRSPNPAAMFTARLQAAMMRLATMTTSVMSWIIARRRAVDGSNASTATGVPWKGKARSSAVRARSIEPRRPVRGDDDRVDGESRDVRRRQVRGRPDRRRRVRVVPEEVRKEVADTRHRRSRSALADRGRLRQLVARDDPERVPLAELGMGSRGPPSQRALRASCGARPAPGLGRKELGRRRDNSTSRSCRTGRRGCLCPALPPPELLASRRWS